MDYLFLLMRDPADQPKAEETAKRAEYTLGLRRLASSPRLIVLAHPDMPVARLTGNRGIVLGELFRRDSYEPASGMFSAHESDQIAASSGRHLIDAYWGNYVYATWTSKLAVLRDPSGCIDCFTTTAGPIRAFFPRMKIAVALGLTTPRVDWQTLGLDIARYTRSYRTCLVGVDELLPGTQFTQNTSADYFAPVWEPWTYASNERQFDDRNAAVSETRTTLLNVTRTFAAKSNHPMSELSGGLDSSIVTACLKAAGANFGCLTLNTADPGADERRYAQAMAEHVNTPLTIIGLSAEHTNLFLPRANQRPRPSEHPLKQITGTLITEEGSRSGFDGFFRGSGGDYIFSYLGTSAPAADALLAHGFGGTFFRAVNDVAAMFRSSFLKAGRLAIRKAFSSPKWPIGSPLNFVSPPAWCPDEINHPWMEIPLGIPPGKVAQVASLFVGQAFREGRDRGGLGPLRMPILAQPVVETALMTPSWMCVAGGRNRAVARDAFKDLLPPEIVQRRTKGNFQVLNGEIFRRNKELVKEMLLDGNLVKHGLLIENELQEAIIMADRTGGIIPTTLLELTCTEAWSQGWDSEEPSSEYRSFHHASEAISRTAFSSPDLRPYSPEARI